MFQPVHLSRHAFTDPFVPRDFAPFNVQAIGDRIYVTFAKQDAQKQDEIDGPGPDRRPIVIENVGALRVGNTNLGGTDSIVFRPVRTTRRTDSSGCCPPRPDWQSDPRPAGWFASPGAANCPA